MTTAKKAASSPKTAASATGQTMTAKSVQVTLRPDERLFIACGCGHTAAHHDDSGCKYVKPAGTDKTSYTTKTWESGPCTCPTSREVVYFGGRKPAAPTEVTA